MRVVSRGDGNKTPWRVYCLVQLRQASWGRRECRLAPVQGSLGVVCLLWALSVLAPPALRRPDVGDGH